jgi:hypothetical protein
MGSSRSEDAKLARLAKLAQETPSPATAGELRQLFSNASHHVVAQAAQITAKAGLKELVQDMVAAFDRYLVDPLQTDKNCVGKIAIIDALNELDCQEPEIFLTGVRYVQMEPRWGKSEDAAGPVRIGSASGLVRIDYRGVLPILVDLLVDGDRMVRIAAAQSLAAHGSDGALLLLRLKARFGDAEADVVAECLAGLLRAVPQESLAFVAEFLHVANPAIVDGALLALGNSHQPEAFSVLQSFWSKEVPPDLRETTLIAISLLRLPVATEFLLKLLAETPEATARSALAALAIHSYDVRLRERVASIVATRANAVLSRLFEEEFTGGH